jgi:hypothetical protein
MSPAYCKKILVTEKNATKQSKNLIKTRKAGKAKEEKKNYHETDTVKKTCNE